ncbi:hypothetical protein [Nonomuraea sp. B19D2]|uniref:hypothetical protein n=1 Tax=Nonomuraea sp. B19D2 TaxID=3159561 RepID=UPI0032DAB175
MVDEQAFGEGAQRGNLLVALAAILRALPGAYATPSRRRTSTRCDSAVRGEAYTGATSSPSSRQRRTCSTTRGGTSRAVAKRPSR